MRVSKILAAPPLYSIVGACSSASTDRRGSRKQCERQLAGVSPQCEQFGGDFRDAALRQDRRRDC